MKPVFVLGGGVAGLAAALLLRERGHAPTLLEAHGWLGGRVASHRDRDTGDWFDNGPHVMLGCYRAMRALLRRLDGERQFAVAPSLRLGFRTAAGAAAQLRLRRLPTPLAFPPAVLALPLPLRDRLRLLRGLLAIVRPPHPACTLQQWIDAAGQRGAPASFLWQPLSRAIMNAEPAEVSAALLLSTLRQAFLGSAADAAFWVPKRPWAEIVGTPAASRLPQLGVAVRTSTAVRGFAFAHGAIAALSLGDGSTLPVPDGVPVVSALPWHALARLLDAPPFAALQGSPIVTAYFELAASVPPLADEGPLVALVDGEPFHFLCRTPGAPPQRFALLAGGNRALDGMQVEAIEHAARAQLRRHYPPFDPAAAARVRIVKEARATFVAAPTALPLRPRPGRLLGGPRNLWLCGDWTDCGLPSTLEGAARSASGMVAAMDAGRS